MSKKSKKIEKETRKLIEATSDQIKRKKGDQYKFRCSKKRAKIIKRACCHWIIRKGKEMPSVIEDSTRPGYWKCFICGRSFPICPDKPENYSSTCNNMLEYVNQMQFWSVKLGGNAEDTKMFIKLKEQIPRFEKASKNIIKNIDKRQQWEKNRSRSDSQFSMYSGVRYQ